MHINDLIAAAKTKKTKKGVPMKMTLQEVNNIRQMRKSGIGWTTIYNTLKEHKQTKYKSFLGWRGAWDRRRKVAA